MSQRAPVSSGTALLKVTRPMTAPSFIAKNLQAPSPTLQRSSKLPAPFHGLWRFEFGSSLELGCWMLVFSYRHPRFQLIHDSDHQPARRALRITDRLPC